MTNSTARNAGFGGTGGVEAVGRFWAEIVYEGNGTTGVGVGAAF